VVNDFTYQSESYSARTTRNRLEHHSPTWHGARIVYTSNRASNFNPEVFAVPAKRLTFTNGGDAVLGDDSMPDFSPDGRRLVFTSSRDQQVEISVMTDADWRP
jgi:Tol biopolymer transport system component